MKPMLLIVVAVLIQLLAHASPAAADAPPAAAETLMRMITAIIENDRGAFVSAATDDLRSGLSAEDFSAIVTQIAPVLSKGFRTRYLGSMKQHGFTVHLWVVTIRGEEDEMLATLSMKDGKVGGFYLE